MKYLSCCADIRVARLLVKKIAPSELRLHDFLERAHRLDFGMVDVGAHISPEVVDQRSYPQQHKSDPDPLVGMESHDAFGFFIYSSYVPRVDQEALKAAITLHYSGNPADSTSLLDGVFGEFKVFVVDFLGQGFFSACKTNQSFSDRSQVEGQSQIVSAFVRSRVQIDISSQLAHIGDHNCVVPFSDVSVTLTGFNGYATLLGNKVTLTHVSRNDRLYTLATSLAYDGIEVVIENPK